MNWWTALFQGAGLFATNASQIFITHSAGSSSPGQSPGPGGQPAPQSFLQKYGIWIAVVSILGVVLILMFARKK